jgi:MFS family permease
MATATTTTLELETLESKSDHVRISTHMPASTPSRDAPAGESLDAPLEGQPITVLSTSRAVFVIAQLIGLQLFSSFCNGISVVGLPAIIDEVQLDSGLLLWPTSVFYLTAGSCLMLAGSIADVIGTRPMVLAANMLLIVSAFACGAARNGGEVIAFRGLQGISFAMAVPASVSIISTNIASGRPRNLGFSCLGFASPLGFLMGLVLGGVMVDNVGWRPAFYLAGATTAALCLFGFWALPHDTQPRSSKTIWTQLASDIDWVGTFVLSAGITILSYVLA